MKQRDVKAKSGPQAGYAPIQILAINATKEELAVLGKEVKEGPVFGPVQRYVPLVRLTETEGILEIPKNKNKELSTKQLAGIYKSVYKRDFNLNDHTVTEDLQADAIKVILTVKQSGKIFDVVFEWFADKNVPYAEFHLLNKQLMTKGCFSAECTETAYKTQNKKTKNWEFITEGREQFTTQTPAPTRYRKIAQGGIGTFLDLAKWFKALFENFEDDETGLAYTSREFDFYNEIGGDDLVYKGDVSALNRLLTLYNDFVPAGERGIYALAGIQFSDKGAFTKIFPQFAQALDFDKNGAIKEIMVDSKNAIRAAEYGIFIPTPIRIRTELTVPQLVTLKEVADAKSNQVYTKGGGSSTPAAGNSADPFGPSGGSAF